ncbi:MAG: heme lyase CcmF/NrfE family subunit [Pseudomonadota bacterium]
MIPQLGQLCVAMAAALALGAAFAGLFGAARPLWHRSAVSMVYGQMVFVCLSFLALVYAFVTDDFSVSYVASHSHSALPVYYKVAAAWGGHEGSFLLWIVIMTLWMAAVALKDADYPPEFHSRVLGILSILNLGFLCFVLFASEPFLRNIPLTPVDGSDLNPLLQDFGQTIHPPMLYVGYVGLSVPFAFAIAALLGGRVDTVWARWTRPWTNVAWASLTAGITLGSWWAYYELGWGGWWFWDPVENASFMPWLAATALLHSLAVTEKRGAFKSWTLLLAITCFSLSLLGSFIVRSGVLTSVHAFAVDPLRGMYILSFLGMVVGGSLLLYALRAGGVKTFVGFAGWSREAFMLLNNVVLVVSLLVVLWGTLYPVGFQAVTDDHISIGPPFFNRFFVPLMCALSLALVLVPWLNWKRTSPQRWRSPLAISAGIALVLLLLFAFVWQPPTVTVLVAVSLALWMIASHLLDLWRKGRRGGLTVAYGGMLLGHLGFAIAMLGIAVTATLSIEDDVRMAPQETREHAGYEVTFLGITGVEGPNYVAQQGIFLIEQGDTTFELRPEKRRYNASGSVMTEAAISAGLFADIYISLGEPLEDGAWAVRLHHKPLVRWVWLGALLMAAGGVVAIFDPRYRRLRRRQQRMQAEPAAAMPAGAEHSV